MGNTQVHTAELSNGMTLIGEVNPHNRSAAIGFFVRTGARDESAKESGVSHFLEHMMFKGTAKRSALDITRHLGDIGAQANAFTSEENTVYYASVVSSYFPAMQELLSDMLRPALDQGEFDTEKNVILEEIALYQDRPQHYFFEHALADYFGAHPAGHSVLGSTQSISDLARNQMKDYFDRRYSPHNITLVAAGNFEWQRFKEEAQKYCAAWKNFETTRVLSRHADRAIQKEYRKKNIQQAHVLLMAAGASAQDQERYPFLVLSNILGDSSGSKIYWDLLESGLAESAGADNDERDGTGCFMAYATCDPRNLEQVTQKLRHILSRPLAFDAGELSRAKTKLCSRLALGGELPFNRMLALGSEWTYNHHLHNLREQIERIKGVTQAEIAAALERFDLKQLSEFRLLPE